MPEQFSWEMHFSKYYYPPNYNIRILSFSFVLPPSILILAFIFILFSLVYVEILIDENFTVSHWQENKNTNSTLQ